MWRSLCTLLFFSDSCSATICYTPRFFFSRGFSWYPWSSPHYTDLWEVLTRPRLHPCPLICLMTALLTLLPCTTPPRIICPFYSSTRVGFFFFFLEKKKHTDNSKNNRQSSQHQQQVSPSFNLYWFWNPSDFLQLQNLLEPPSTLSLPGQTFP